MRTIWVDAGHGAAGDMLLAALLDAGADMAAVRAGLRGIPAGQPPDLELAGVRRHGLRSAMVTVRAPAAPAARTLADIASILSRSGLPGPAHEFALAVFRRLADAEARVHGAPADQIRFGEVGALDAIADVTGCALALHSLDLLQARHRVVSPVAVGSGTPPGAHGSAGPAPAVLQLLTEARAPIRAHASAMELCTPTGAALLATLATRWGGMPDCTALAVGVGAGRRDPHDHPNVLRVLVGEEAGQADWTATGMSRIDATIDDLDPRLWPDVLDALHAAGAGDAWCTPALMRKGRPGHVLSVLAAPDRLDGVCRAVFEQTTTLGLRVSGVQRRALRRDQVEVHAVGARVSVKRGLLGDRVITVQPEYDDVRAAARQSGQPVAAVLAQAAQAARAAPP